MSSRMGKRRIRRVRARVLKRHGRWCWLCNNPIGRYKRVTLDHVEPFSLGGTHHIDNLRPAHLRCNEARRNGPPPPLELTKAMLA